MVVAERSGPESFREKSDNSSLRSVLGKSLPSWRSGSKYLALTIEEALLNACSAKGRSQRNGRLLLSAIISAIDIRHHSAIDIRHIRHALQENTVILLLNAFMAGNLSFIRHS